MAGPWVIDNTRLLDMSRSTIYHHQEQSLGGCKQVVPL